MITSNNESVMLTKKCYDNENGGAWIHKVLIEIHKDLRADRLERGDWDPDPLEEVFADALGRQDPPNNN